MSETFTETLHPRDPAYVLKRQKQIDELMKLTPQQLRRQLNYTLSQPAPSQEGTTTKNALGELRGSPTIPLSLKGILDSTGGTTGNVLIRQDLEATLHNSRAFIR